MRLYDRSRIDIGKVASNQLQHIPETPQLVCTVVTGLHIIRPYVSLRLPSPNPSVNTKSAAFLTKQKASLMHRQIASLHITDDLRAAVSNQMPPEVAGFLPETICSRIGQMK